MKQVYLLCNAHIDPVWQWEWEEGLTEALSTFRVAADFCEQFDGFVFNHNEALLYKWVEEYEPDLFARIRRLVAQGKWHIMGGWYLQPDCNMPSAESIVRQITVGRRYFREKFGVVPTTAVSVDAFGHSRGLVQLLKKCGYDSYLCFRPPMDACGVPDIDFNWVGYDGATVMVHIANEGYNSFLGRSTEKIRDYCGKHQERDRLLVLWGVGDHGGGPSRKDLEDIACLQAEWAQKGVELLHSTPEEYFAGMDATALPRHERDLNPTMVGCYTSQTRIKQKHRALENALFQTEKMAAATELMLGLHFDWAAVEEAQRLLLFCEFHDILPGSSVQRAEEASLRMMDRGLDLLKEVRMRAFIALANRQPKMEEGTIPLFAYNPYPYPVKRLLTCEFQMPDQNRSGTFTDYEVFVDGKRTVAQIEKEDSSIPIDWRKRVVFEAELAPFAITPVCCRPVVRERKPVIVQPDGPILPLENARTRLVVNKATGLIDEYSVDGVSLLRKGACRLLVIRDNEDPWTMTANEYPEVCGEFTLADADAAGRIAGLKHPLEPVRIIEQGAVRTVVEAIFVYGRSAAVVQYACGSTAAVEINVRLFWMEPNHMVKLSLPTCLDNTTCYGKVMAGRDRLRDDGTENVAQKWIAVTGEGRAVTLINEGVYGSSFQEGELRMTLLRSPAYCAHPIEGRELLPQDRYLPRIDIGERRFRFVLQGGEEAERLASVGLEAQLENEQPFVYSFFSKGDAVVTQGAPVMEVSNRHILLTALRREADGYLVRLYNPMDSEQSTAVRLLDAQTKLSFGPFAMRAFHLVGSELREVSLDGNAL